MSAILAKSSQDSYSTNVLQTNVLGAGTIDLDRLSPLLGKFSPFGCRNGCKRLGNCRASCVSGNSPFVYLNLFDNTHKMFAILARLRYHGF